MISFEKFHGTGNDFILIDDRLEELNLNADQIALLCKRHSGIGADGLILLRNKDGYDFDMLYYNADGKPGSMCGNGARCATAFAHHLKMFTRKAIFNAFDGKHTGEIISDDPYIVKVQMNDPKFIEIAEDFIFMDTGSPHYIVFTSGVKEMDVVSEGRKIRNNHRFRDYGTNVNFIETIPNGIFVRTYERGVENETLSCGTGVVASAIAHSIFYKADLSHCKVLTQGGELHVSFDKKENNFNHVFLQGPVIHSFSGKTSLV